MQRTMSPVSRASTISVTDLEDVSTDEQTLSLGDGGSKVHEPWTVPWVTRQHQDLWPETSRAGGLCLYTGFTGTLNGRDGIPVRLFVPLNSVTSGKHFGKCRSSLKEKNFFS